MTRRSLVSRVRAALAAAAAAWQGRPLAGVPGPLAAPTAATGPRPSPTAGLEQLLRLFKHSDSGLLVCHRDDRLVLGSPVAARLFGVEPPAMRGTHVTQWLEPLAGARSHSTHTNTHTGGSGGGADGEAASAFFSGQWETIARRADGSSFPAEVTVTETQLDGRAQRVLIVRDITDRRLTQERLMQLANFDSLTGLPNRTLFRDRLAQAMGRARRSGVPMVLMFLDLDNFKVINDSLGHEVGDQLLRHVAQMLESCLRDTDTVALRSEAGGRGAADAITVSRLGGDEFTVIAEQVASAEDAALLARRVLEAVATPLQLLEHELHVSASIGISMYPVDDTDLDGLVRHTDMAMYRSKAMGRGVYSFYSHELSAEVAARLSMENDLRRALERHEFALHYQPKFHLGTGQVSGVEALIRWHSPGRGLVPPDRFIGVLEDSGLILPVGAWAIRTACTELATWDAAGAPRLTMAVNLSARQFRQPFLARFVADTLAEAGIAPHRLELELTESLLLDDSENNRNVLGSLAEMGVRVAIDDFGTGHSSLSYLKRFDIDTLKIDRSFVSELPHDSEDAAIATAIVAMGHSLHMKVVAEGVETIEQAEFLYGLGCDEIQGYLISRALPAPQLLEWLQERAERDGGAPPAHPMQQVRADAPDTLRNAETLGAAH
jgi:diguanylate cyclase (GGDEF)-like protein/PAS domain S-box-containing protein